MTTLCHVVTGQDNTRHCLLYKIMLASQSLSLLLFTDCLPTFCSSTMLACIHHSAFAFALPLPWNALLPDIYTAHSLHSGLSSNVISSKIFLRVTSSEKISLTNHCLKSYPQHTCTKSLLCLCLPIGLPIPI